jgi:tRNA dimethylallyltransferase
LNQSPTVIIIAGPTAVGKTALSVQLAEQLGGEIISADSRQCYRELSIGVARPSPEELQRVKHHFIASHSLHDQINAISFEQVALAITDQLFQKSNFVVMTGGTGLYIKAFMEGLDPIPPVSAEMRERIQKEYEEKGLIWLQTQIQELDPEFWKQAEQQNPRRLQRALEVVTSTGQSILHYRKSAQVERPFRILPFCLTLPTDVLRKRIDQRIDAMLAAGWLEEVKTLIPFRHLPALQTVGYQELFDYLDGTHSMEEAIQKIRINTWHYARRQMTWWRRQPGFIQLSANQSPIETILRHC